MTPRIGELLVADGRVRADELEAVVNVVYGQGEPGAELDLIAIHELQQVCAAAPEAYLRILRARVA